MPQFTVYKNPNRRSRRRVPFVLDVQADLLDRLATRVVVPLVLASDMRAARHLNPTFEVDGKAVVMSTAEVAGVPLSAIGAPVADLSAKRSAIIAALDFLLTGV
jgi:toxin CcdB